MNSSLYERKFNLNTENKRSTTRIYHISAWIIWGLLLFTSLEYISGPFIYPVSNPESEIYFKLFITVLIIFALLEAIITILVRYFFIIRPYKKGTYDPNVKFTRYFVVGVISWVCSSAICFYGPITYQMFGLYWPHIIFGIIGVFLLLYHSPRMGPFKQNDTNVSE